MAKRARKRARRSHKKSRLEKLFTFPMLALYLFVLLSLLTIYQVIRPTESVIGVTDPETVTDFGVHKK